MEEPKMTWTEEKTLNEAEKAPNLSALLEEMDFRIGAIRWLKGNHITKFLKALDAAEAAKLRQFAERFFSGNYEETYGFPLLEKLFEFEACRELVICLAGFEPEWIGRWSKWRIKEKKFRKYPL